MMFWPIVQLNLKIYVAHRVSGIIHATGALLIIILYYAYSLQPDQLQSSIAPILWVNLLLCSLLNMPQLFQVDADNGLLEQWRTEPIPLSQFVAAKACAHWIACIAPLLALTIFIAPYLAPTTSDQWLVLAISLFIGSAAMTAINVIGAALTMAGRIQNSVQTLIVLPLHLPVLIAGNMLTSESGAWALLIGLTALLVPASIWISARLLRLR